MRTGRRSSRVSCLGVWHRHLAGGHTGWKPVPHVAKRAVRRAGYVLLETVLATGLLVTGMAVIGAQIQDAHRASVMMERELRAMMLAEMHIALMDAGQLELESLDLIEEQEFGPQYPEWAWRMTTDETAIDELFQIKLEILHQYRTDVSDPFDFEEAEVVEAFYLIRVMPKGLDFETDLGLREDELEEMDAALSSLGIDGLDLQNFDMGKVLRETELEELAKMLPVLMEAFPGIDITQVMSQLPPEVQEALKAAGIGDMLGGDGEGGGP